MLSELGDLEKRYEVLAIGGIVHRRGFKPSAHYEFITIFFMTSTTWNIVYFSDLLENECVQYIHMYLN